jgi:putative thiamine transport system permease protein
VWQDLNDADTFRNARGMAGAVWLTIVLATTAVLLAAAARMLRSVLQRRLCAGPAAHACRRPRGAALTAGLAIAGVYGATGFVLFLMSIAARWPYPDLWPEEFGSGGWAKASVEALGASIGLGLATATASLVLAVLWLETAPARQDWSLTFMAGATVMLPPLTIAAGQYRELLAMQITGGWPALFLVHLTPVFAYVWIVLRAPYRAFDPRWNSVGVSLNASPLRFWTAVKLPLLRAPIAAAAAIGFAVSLAQFVPAQLAAAGRHATLPMEAVTLAAGGSRSLMAVHALLLALPCIAAFAFAARAGRARRIVP